MLKDMTQTLQSLKIENNHGLYIKIDPDFYKFKLRCEFSTGAPFEIEVTQVDTVSTLISKIKETREECKSGGKIKIKHMD